MIANLVGGLIFSGIGFVALAYAKGEANIKIGLIGIALMGYPYFVTNTLAMYAVGIALTASLFYFRAND